MKVSELWKLIPKEVLVIFTEKHEIKAQMWLGDVDKPELLEREISSLWPVENRVLCVEVLKDEKNNV